MKSTIQLLLSLMICCAIATSCNDDDTAARQFVDRLTTALSDGNADSLKLLYPAGERVGRTGNFKMLVKLLDTESAKYKDLGDGTWRVTVGDSIKVTIAENDDDQFTIKESFGLIDFGQERTKFALATGWIDKSMNDVQKAERLSDSNFVEWVGADFLSRVKKNVSIKKTGTFGDIKDEGTWVCSDGIRVTVTNRNDFDIPSDAYVIECSDWSRSHPRDTCVVEAAGDDLRAHAKMTVNVDILTTMESKSKQCLVWDDQVLLSLIYRHHDAKGTEYKLYEGTRGK